MADIFVSYTSSDHDWAMWIAKELQALGHKPYVHEWEIGAGDDIYAWMEARHGRRKAILRRRGRSTSVPWRSARRRSAPTTPIPPSCEETLRACLVRQGP